MGEPNNAYTAAAAIDVNGHALLQAAENNEDMQRQEQFGSSRGDTYHIQDG